jgi:hypothetical protein
MSLLTSAAREAIIRRRGYKSDGDGKVHRISNLRIHDKDRNRENNNPRNLRVLTEKEHEDLHRRAGY